MRQHIRSLRHSALAILATTTGLVAAGPFGLGLVIIGAKPAQAALNGGGASEPIPPQAACTHGGFIAQEIGGWNRDGDKAFDLEAFPFDATMRASGIDVFLVDASGIDVADPDGAPTGESFQVPPDGPRRVIVAARAGTDEAAMSTRPATGSSSSIPARYRRSLCRRCRSS